MNIIYISPSNGIGGAELSLSEIIIQSAKKGHNVYVVLGYPKKGDNKLYDIIKNHCKGIYFIRQMRWHIPNKMSWFDRKINYFYHFFLSGWHIVPVIKIFRLVKKLKIDIIHTNTFWGIDGMLAAKILSVPHIWHIREPIGKNNGAIINFPLQNYPKLVWRVMDSFNSKIIANSKYTASFLEPYFPKNKLRIIYNSLPDSWFELKKNKTINNKVIIGSIANVTAEWKNHRLIIEVAKLIKNNSPNHDITFNIYGRIPENSNSYYLSLLKMINEYELSSVVFFKGLRDPNEIYNDIDILFHPCDREGFGRIFIEAMGKGVPIITVNGGGADELIKTGKTGFKFDKNDENGIAKKIIDLTFDGDTFKKISFNGYNYASSNFSIDLMWKKISNCYKIILKK